MSRTDASETSETTSWFVWTKPPVGDPDAIVAAAAAVFAALEVSPTRAIVTSAGAAVRWRSARAGRLNKLGADAKTRALMVVNGDERVEMDLQLRAGPADTAPPYLWRFGLRCVAPCPCPQSVVDDFFGVVMRHYPVIHGAGIRVSSHWHARTEADLGGASAHVGSDVTKRIGFDAMHHNEAQEKLRRLYPVTIIGPEIWAKLPPLPRLEHPPTVTDLGNCKVLTAWPTLCDPRDPAFLRGTVALREWLWPHTIQNPADHVAEDPYEYGQG